MKRLLMIFILFFLAEIVSAAEIFEMNQSIRRMGMGGVAAPFPSPTEAIYVNPAGLADVSGMHWQILNLAGGINGLSIANSLSSTGSISSTSQLASYMGKPVNIGIQGGSSFVLPYFGFAAFDDAKVGFEIMNPAYPTMKMTYLNDMGFAMGFAANITPISSFGIVAKRITRTGGPAVDVGLGAAITPSTITDNFNQSGVGYGVDLGYNLRLPIFSSPTLAIVWHDAGDTAFNATGSGSAPARLENNMVVGLGNSIDLPGLDIQFGMEYRHVYQNDIQLGKKLNFGTEISLPLIDLRAGLHQGYPSYGLGFDLLFLQFDASMYTEETGVYPGQRPDQRVQLGISFEVGFDANFNISSLTKDAKKRKLKLRR